MGLVIQRYRDASKSEVFVTSTEIFASAHGPGTAYSFNPGNSMFDAPKLREHAVKVMETIGLAVSSIDNPAKLQPVLLSLGKTHATQHNVKDNQCAFNFLEKDDPYCISPRFLFQFQCDSVISWSCC